MVFDIEELCDETINVYRTKNYIVKQSFYLEFDDAGDMLTFSKDVFFARTNLRDLKYDIAFAEREVLDGRRIPTMSSSRRYIK